MYVYTQTTSCRACVSFVPLIRWLLIVLQYFQSKSYCEDLTEGKFSFPIIHAIQSNPTDRRLLSILKQRTENVDLKKYAVDYMVAMGSLEHTRTKILEIRAQIDIEIQRLGGNAYVVSDNSGGWWLVPWACCWY
jgi:hypothetical protein